MQKYFVSHSSQQMGPYTVDEIVRHVAEGTLSPLDYVYDESKSDWLLFLEHPELAEKVKELKPKAPPQVQKNSEVPKKESVKAAKKGNLPSVLEEAMSHEWFILKGENKFGPFAYTDVVKMLQQGVVYEFDFAWHEGREGWDRIAELSYFNKDNMRALKENSMPEISEVFFRRRHRRVNYGSTIIVHDNKKVWKGKAVEISEGGAGVIMENAMVIPGQELYLHFKPGDGVPPFNAVCEVVSKQYVSDLADKSSPVRYGLKFKSVSTEAEGVIKEFTKKAA